MSHVYEVVKPVLSSTCVICLILMNTSDYLVILVTLPTLWACLCSLSVYYYCISNVWYQSWGFNLTHPYRAPKYSACLSSSSILSFICLLFCLCPSVVKTLRHYGPNHSTGLLDVFEGHSSTDISPNATALPHHPFFVHPDMKSL